MSAKGISRFEVFDKLECQGGKRLSTGGFIPTSASITTRSLQQIEQVALTMPREGNDAANVIREGYIIRRWRSDTNVREYPVGPLTFNTGDDATVDVVARDIKYRLGEVGLVTQPGVTPLDELPILTYSITGTPADLVNRYLTARDPSDTLASRLTWVDTGTVEPTTEITLNVDRWSPQQFLDGIIAALESVNVFAEWDLPKNGATNYLIDILLTPLAT